jgi:hypothetical protein
MKQGRCGTMTHDYKRNGTTTLFAALNVLGGDRGGRMHAAPSPSRVPAIHAQTGPGVSAGFGSASDSGQRWNPPASEGEERVGQAPPISTSFHTHPLLLAQSGGALVCQTHERVASAAEPFSVSRNCGGLSRSIWNRTSRSSGRPQSNRSWRRCIVRKAILDTQHQLLAVEMNRCFSLRIQRAAERVHISPLPVGHGRGLLRLLRKQTFRQYFRVFRSK